MQETFTQDFERWVEGGIIDDAGAARVTALAKETIPFGRVVVQLSTDEDGTCRLPPAIPVADPDAIQTDMDGAAAPTVYTVADFDGIVGAGVINPARNVTATFASDADWDATNMTVEGLDANGNEIIETIAIPNGGATTVVGILKFSRVTRITIPTQSGACAGTLGLGVDIGVMKVLGIAAADFKREGPAPYAEFDAVLVLRQGSIAMRVEAGDATEYGLPVYARAVTAGLEVRGTVRTTPDGTLAAPDAVLVEGAIFGSRAAATELAKVILNIP